MGGRSVLRTAGDPAGDGETTSGNGLTPTLVGYAYIGDGAGIPDVPARDIRPDEIGRFDGVALVVSGLYRPILADAPAAAPGETEE